MDTTLDALCAALAPGGLNLAAVVSPAEWNAHAAPDRQAEALLPGAQAMVVIGNGGRALWDAFVADLARHPGHLCDEPHPLDAFVRRAVERADAVLGDIPRRWFYAAATETFHLDFRVLGWLAGFGARSRLGLLIHPRYGTWLGMRAACVLAEPLQPNAERVRDLCAGCPAPCVQVCPGEAFPDGHWSVAKCADFKRASETCRSACASRDACPVGAAHRYPDLAIAYHNHRASGRPALAASLGFAPGADRYAGEGPLWDGWKRRIDVGAVPKA